MTAATLVVQRPEHERRASAIAAAVRRVDGIFLSADAALMISRWLGQHGKSCVARYGSLPDGLAEVQYALAEAVAAGSSRNRDETSDVVTTAIALGHEESGGVVTVATASRLLGVRPDTVRKWCRDGVLDAVKDGSRWFPKAAAVQELSRTMRSK